MVEYKKVVSGRVDRTWKLGKLQFPEPICQESSRLLSSNLKKDDTRGEL